MISKIEYYISKVIKKFHFKAIEHSKIEANVKIQAGSHIYNSHIGRFTDIGYDCRIIYCNLGSFCSIGANVIVGGASHAVDWISTSTVFNNNKDALKKKYSNNHFDPYKVTNIGHDVWIGDGVFIKSGIKIGSGAVIGMGSVVTKDIPPFQIWAGNPAKFIRLRFDQPVIDKILSIEWWNWDDKRLLDYGNYFNDLDLFLEKFEKHNIN